MKKIKMLFVCLLALALIPGAFAEQNGVAGNAASGLRQGHRTITGRVVDENGEPLAGASVIVPGTTIGAMTDADGNWTLSVPEGTVRLEVSNIGFVSRIIPLTSAGNYDLTLPEDQELLEEVVVVGYGTQKKVNLTGSVATVNFENLSTKSRPMFNAGQALTGASPGLQVLQSSGQPYSEGFSYNIRGIGTMNSSGPLVLVDGMEQSVNNVNPNDIASISILKDAASCAIYGNRGANGVILVTTKNGSPDGRISVDFNATFSYDEPFKIIHTIANYADYMELMNESSRNIGGGDIFSSITIQKWRDAEQHPNDYAESGYPNFVAYPNTDWWEEIYQNKWMQKYSVSVNGAEKRSGYNISLSYLDNPGLMRNTGYKRYFFRANVYSDITKWLRAGTRIWGYLTDRDKSNTGSLTNLDTEKMIPGVYPYYNGMYGAPEATEEDPQSHNPLWDMNISRGYHKHTQLFSDFYAKVKFLRHFSYDVDLYFKDYREEGQSIDNDYGKYSFQSDSWSAPPRAVDQLYTSMDYNRENHYKLDQLLNYSQTFGSHDVSAMLGYEEQHFVSRTGSFTKLGLIDASIGDPSTASDPYSSTGSGSEWGARSWFGRVNYSFKDRYLLEADIRYDGSSRFAPETRWGLFPSFSAGWRISKEPFMENVRDLDNLKLRLSWGKLGNNSIGNYEWQSVYSAATYPLGNALANGIAITSIANEALEWESTAIANLGIDFGFFGGRLDGTLDVYNKLTDGILYRPDMFMVLGNATGPRQNIAEVTNRGIEFELGWREQIGKDFSYAVRGNIAYNKNWVSKYKGTLERGWVTNEDGTKEYRSNIGDVSTGGNTRRLEGHMLDEWFIPDVYKGSGEHWNADGTPDINGGPVDGMIRTTEDMKWLRAMIQEGYTFYPRQTIDKANLWYGEYLLADTNGDGIYGNEYDREFQHASTTPKVNFGLQLSASWKGVDLSMNWTGAAGFKLYYYRLSQNHNGTVYGYTIGDAIAKDHYFFDPKNPDDPRTNITSRNARLANLNNTQTSATSSLHLERGDFFKLRNFTLGYTLPKNLVNRAFMQSLRVYVTGENLFALTKFTGLDPEMRANAGYSTMRQYAFGVDITF